MNVVSDVNQRMIVKTTSVMLQFKGIPAAVNQQRKPKLSFLQLTP